MDGYRPNSQQWQLSGSGSIRYNASDKMNMGAEYSLLRNRIQMPGGLTDSLFNSNPKESTRARNWLKSPWNIVNAYINLHPSGNTTINVNTTYIFSNRSLVWRNEDGGPAALDTIEATTHQFANREVGSEDMHSITTEARISTNYRLGKTRSTLAAGMRLAHAWFKRQGGGEGTTGSDFDLSITGDWGYDLDFTTTNIAPFAENIFRVGSRLSITPGARFEYLRSTSKGYKTVDNIVQTANEARTRTYPLFGLGLEFRSTANTNIYANISQAYRPIDYSQLEPFGVTSIIDPHLKDAHGFNSDLGYRGTIGNYLNFDLGLFYMVYNNRVGEVVKTDPGTGKDFAYRTNIAESTHKGIESYIEFNLLKCLDRHSTSGLSIFNSFAYIDARYGRGEFEGHRVEAASKIIERMGVTYSNCGFSGTFQVNYTGDAYGDATNARLSDNPIAGYIPAYTVLDLSATYKWSNYAVKGGVNNLADRSYFTRRTDEYPGPGIIPAVGRSWYLGLSARF